MGFSLQFTVVRGRIDPETLTQWVHAAKPRKPMRGPVTVLFFNVTKRTGQALDPAKLPLPALPAKHAETQDDESDAFMVALAQLAHADGRAALDVQDSSISECGHVIAPGRTGLSWTEENADEGRERATALMAEVLGEATPDLADLQEASGETFWERQIS